jgi:RNA-directed DNA polymerase
MAVTIMSRSYVAGTLKATAIGTPQGGPLSPLLVNILLDDLDKELESRGHRFVRYADDLLILVRSHRAGERVMASVSRYLTATLKLVVNTHKSRVVKTDDCEFLGSPSGARSCVGPSAPTKTSATGCAS